MRGKIVFLLSEYDLYFVLACSHDGNNISFYCLAVYCHGLNALANVGRILDGDVVYAAAEFTGSLKAVPCRRDGRIYRKAVEIGLDTEDVL